MSTMSEMFANGPDRGPPSAVRGWLSDIYFPALLDVARERTLEGLVLRLGAKATLDDPLFGRVAGFPALQEHLRKTAAWLSERSASYERLSFTTGVDRDVTEGTLALTFESKTVDLPVAVVAERRRSREVELRLYFSTQPIFGSFKERPRLVPSDPELKLPPVIAEHVDALRAGDVKGALAAFQENGFVRESRGVQHAKSDGGLKEFYEKLFAGGAFGGGLELERGGMADDGRTCALEYTLTKICGRDVPPQAGLLVYERGDSALLRAVRIYDNVE